VTRFRFAGAAFTTRIGISTLADACMVLSDGLLLGPPRTQSAISVGTSGEIHKARSMRLEQMVAIKVRVRAAGIWV
jgi:hypothetical protein